MGEQVASPDPVYVYAIVAHTDFFALPETGIDPARPVELLAVANVQAVISHVRSETFNEEDVRAGLQNKTWLATHVLAHQQVMDWLVSTGAAVIPMRFCTLYPDVNALTSSLARHDSALQAELARLQGKQEWGVKQSVNLLLLQQAITEGNAGLAGVEMDEAIARLRTQIAGMSAGTAYLLKKRLTTLVADRAQSVAFAIADDTLRSLSEAAEAAVTSDLSRDQPDVCLNAAFLVETARYGEFHGQLERLAETYATVGVHYELIGPWPAHHFLRLNLDTPEVSE